MNQKAIQPKSWKFLHRIVYYVMVNLRWRLPQKLSEGATEKDLPQQIKFPIPIIIFSGTRIVLEIELNNYIINLIELIEKRSRNGIYLQSLGDKWRFHLFLTKRILIIMTQPNFQGQQKKTYVLDCGRTWPSVSVLELEIIYIFIYVLSYIRFFFYFFQLA